jgi:hypothetical protein
MLTPAAIETTARSLTQRLEDERTLQDEREIAVDGVHMGVLTAARTGSDGELG